MSTFHYSRDLFLLYCSDDIHSILRWRHAFLLSLICGIPVMVIMVIFHWILHTPMHPERQTPIFTPALSLDNLLLLLLCTPVQVRLGYGISSHVPRREYQMITVSVSDLVWPSLLHGCVEGCQTRNDEHGCSDCVGDIGGLCLFYHW